MQMTTGDDQPPPTPGGGKLQAVKQGIQALGKLIPPFPSWPQTTDQFIYPPGMSLPRPMLTSQTQHLQNRIPQEIEGYRLSGNPRPMSYPSILEFDISMREYNTEDTPIVPEVIKPKRLANDSDDK